MKVLQANAGVLTNCEVLDFLRSRGATSDSLGSLGAVAPSECKVCDFLVNSAACNQTREAVNEFMKRCEKFKLAKAEKLCIINLRPSTHAEIYPIIEDCDKRFDRNGDQGTAEIQELLDLVVKVLPPPPAKPEEEKSNQEAE